MAFLSIFDCILPFSFIFIFIFLKWWWWWYAAHSDPRREELERKGYTNISPPGIFIFTRDSLLEARVIGQCGPSFGDASVHLQPLRSSGNTRHPPRSGRRPGSRPKQTSWFLDSREVGEGDIRGWSNEGTTKKQTKGRGGGKKKTVFVDGLFDHQRFYLPTS